MKLEMFAIYDAKAEAYLPPFCMPAVGLALRAFQDMAVDPSHQVGQHPEDYTLFRIGTYNPADATIELLEAKASMGTAHEWIKHRQNEKTPQKMA